MLSICDVIAIQKTYKNSLSTQNVKKLEGGGGGIQFGR